MTPGIDFDGLVKWSGCFPVHDIRPVDRLAAALFVNCRNPRARIMAMFTAYFDASGDAISQPFVVVVSRWSFGIAPRKENAAVGNGSAGAILAICFLMATRSHA